MGRAKAEAMLGGVGYGRRRLDDESLADRIDTEPPRHIRRRKQRRPLDSIARFHRAAEQQGELPFLLLPWPDTDPDATEDLWRRIGEFVPLGDEPIAPETAEARSLAAVDLLADAVFQAAPEIGLIRRPRAC
jgi:hypothetical protein